MADLKIYWQKWYSKNKQHRKEYNKNHYQRNRLRIRNQQKDYYDLNKGYILTKKSVQREQERLQKAQDRWKESLEDKVN
jgi:hypothetical protein